MASRRRSLATIFDTAAARNAVTPATLVTPGVPAANSAQAVFVATEAFEAEDALFAPLFNLATGISDLLGVRFQAYTDPSDSIADFNTALMMSIGLKAG
ncbi:hypothetical protein CYMTET_36836 [Cymbomonas tetramitiformis]|uniref:Uncharacterized protein n=1 Tax=Cymbomonas tetramitiformis TaxID=36881 RepID=A0AAE0CF73_9CHLO|nr:hypothetical protein CYMTET_36836 [Cymbomonas tetramitiformis]